MSTQMARLKFSAIFTIRGTVRDQLCSLAISTPGFRWEESKKLTHSNFFVRGPYSTLVAFRKWAEAL